MALLSEANLCDADVVVPLTLFDRQCLEGRHSPNAIVPTAASEALCHDKLAFNLAVMEAGLGKHIPAIVEVPDSFPVILKRRRDAWGEHSRILHGLPPSALDPAEHFLQAYIPGNEEWATHLLLRNGQVMFEATIRYEMPLGPYVKGIRMGELRSEWQTDETPHLECFQRILQAVGFTEGTCCFDYRVHEGVPLVFELNPRFGGSLMGQIGPYLDAYRAALAVEFA
ncbi:hypothetical protein EOD42_07610 [Rhodovarius crocodyli]|uniref:ATP-grasp domain-containing protein n=1 Tax=Rhodovarius crocodyli TaxID=1979269 RepID=A0A437MJ71_9PROT|nr:hypothetical protein [Rhodovarius crocodyli]RVT97673.1 hypothetical protein EOD42_07610 [Rhodovarius crocodyli]